MPLHIYLERMKHIDYLIRKKATGNLTSFARKLKLSKTQTVNFLNEMKELGFPIEYSRKMESYYYAENGRMASTFFEKYTKNEKKENVLSSDELKRITGGKTFLNLFVHSNYS